MIDRQFKAHIEKNPWAYIKKLREDQDRLIQQYESERIALIKEIESLKAQLRATNQKNENTSNS